MNYTVQKGDTLWDLSRKHGIPLQDLMRQMPESVRRDPRTLQPGMNLTLPGPDKTGPWASQGASRPSRDPSTYREQMTAWNGNPGVSPQDKFQQDMERGIVGGTMAGGEAMLGGAALHSLGQGMGSMARQGMNNIGRRMDAAQEAQAAARSQQQQLNSLYNRPRSPSTGMEPLLPGQQRIQRMMDAPPDPRGPGVPMELDIARMQQNASRGGYNPTLESLYRLGGEGGGGSGMGSTVRTHPSRMGTTVRNNPDREMYARGLEKLPGGSWGRKVYDSRNPPQSSGAPMTKEEFDLLAAANRYMGETGQAPVLPPGIMRHYPQ